MPPDLQNLEQRIRNIEGKLDLIIYSDRYLFQKTIHLLHQMQIQDGRDIQLGANTGTKIGTATTQKIGFYNKAPVVQASGNDQSAVTETAGGTYGTNEQTMMNNLKSLTNALRSALVDLGLIKGSV